MENVGYEQPWTNEYGSSDVITDGNNIPSTNEQYANAYGQQAEIESHQLQTQSQPDEYYTVSPGENYYADYNSNQPYPSQTTEESGGDTGGYVSANTIADVSAPNVHEPFNQSAQEVTIEQQQIPDEVQIERLPRQNRIPNYLQSDTDDSQIGYIEPSNANATSYPDSDFEFSTNS